MNVVKGSVVFPITPVPVQWTSRLVKDPASWLKPAPQQSIFVLLTAQITPRSKFQVEIKQGSMLPSSFPEIIDLIQDIQAHISNFPTRQRKVRDEAVSAYVLYLVL